MFQRCTGAQTPNYSDVQKSVPVKLAVTINKESSEKGQNKGFFFSLSVLAALFVYFRVFGLLETDEILERCRLAGRSEIPSQVRDPVPCRSISPLD